MVAKPAPHARDQRVGFVDAAVLAVVERADGTREQRRWYA
jgi:hypothetical protein